MRRDHEKERITMQHWKHAVVLGFTLFVAGQGLLTWGTQYLSSGITALLNSTVPLWIAILAFIIFRNHFSKSTLVGLCAGFGGLMLLVAPSIGTGQLSAVGTLALLLSSVSGFRISLFIKGEFASMYPCILCHGNDYWRDNAYHNKHTTRGIS